MEVPCHPALTGSAAGASLRICRGNSKGASSRSKAGARPSAGLIAGAYNAREPRRLSLVDQLCAQAGAFLVLTRL